MTYAIRLVTVITVLAAVTASAQSLGDVANREEARRKSVQGSGKVYTNENLRPEPPPSVPPTPSASATDSTSAAVKKASDDTKKAADDAKKPVDESNADEPKKDEAYWKARVTKARDDLGRAQTFADALQSRINALTADFAARSDPAQRAQIGNDRNKALAELDRVKKEIEDNTKAIAAIQEDARKAGVPAGWVR